MSSKIKFIFIVSLILNFLFAGLLIGHYSKSYMNKHGKDAKFTEFAEKLPDEKREFVLDRMSTIREENRELKDRIREVKEELRDIIRTHEFNEQLYDQKVSEMHELYRTKAKNIAAVIKEMAKNFTTEERAMLSDYLEKRKHRHKKDHRDYKNKKSE